MSDTPVSSEQHPSTEETSGAPDVDSLQMSQKERELRAIIGQTVSDRYRITALIGTGGMGAVYEAEHIGIGKKVAVKFISKENARENTVASRFAREARAASAIESEHIVSVFDAGTHDSRPFIVMELLRGEDFGQRLRRLGKIDSQEAVHVIAQVLRGLADAHDAGIIHRDLKPDNVFLVDKRGDTSFVKIVDFGVSKIERPDGGTAPLALTKQGTVVGTPYYMSPEQAQAAADLDARADLFSVGAMLFESLAGRPPHVGNTYEAVIVSICMNDAPDLKTLVPEISTQLARFVARALQRDRKARFSSARQMLVALSEFAPGERVSGDEGRASGREALANARTQDDSAPFKHTALPSTKPSPQTSQRSSQGSSQGPESGEPRRTSTSWIAADRIPSVVSTPSPQRSKKTLVITGIVATVAGGLATTLILAHGSHRSPADSPSSVTSNTAVASASPSTALSGDRLAPASAGPRLVVAPPQTSAAVQAAATTVATATPTIAASATTAKPKPTATQKHPKKQGDLDLDRDFP
jgi:eukaryotic-like serine/threonine-protein kinase